MSLANEKDLIIRNTITPIRALADEANSGQGLEDYMRNSGKVMSIVEGRIEGKPLEELVTPSRISDGQEKKEKDNVETRAGSFYDALVR